jgi:hypothetical protein
MNYPGTAFIVGNTLIGLDEDVDDPSRDDVLNSTLYAQLDADRTASKYQDMERWFCAYRNTLATLGWKIVRENNETWARSDSLSAQEKTLKMIQRVGNPQLARLTERCIGAFQSTPAPNWQEPTTPWQEVPPISFMMIPCVSISTRKVSIVLAANGALCAADPDAWMSGQEQTLRIRACCLELDTDHYRKNRWAIQEHLKLEALKMIRITLLS